MDLWGTIGSAALGAAPSLFQNYTNARLVDDTNKQNREIANDQMRFQERMSSTSHQREVQDLQAAGLNPTLSAGGSGSSTPGGASATMTAPQIQLPDMMSFGLSMRQLDQADQKLQIDKQNSAAGIAKSMSETELNKMKKILTGKGMPKAMLEGEASQVLRKVIDWMKNAPRKQPNLYKDAPKPDNLLQYMP